MIHKPNNPPSRLRRTASAALAVLFAGVCTPLHAEDSLARFVPAQAGLFVEVRGAQDILTALTEPQIWSTLAEFAGQPSRPEDAAEWRRRVMEAVGLSPDEAIRVLFARGVAFVGQGAGRAQDAVVICRPAHDHSPVQLLEQWNATRIKNPASPMRYILPGNIGVARHAGLLLFGDPLRPGGMFERVVRAAGAGRQKNLADDPTYQALLSRVPPHPDGVLFARLAQADPTLLASGIAASQPVDTKLKSAAALPGPLRSAENVLFALHREGPLLHFTAVGDTPPKPSLRPVDSATLLANLPVETLAAWEGRVDLAKLAARLENLPPRSVLRVVLHFPNQLESATRLGDALSGRTCVAMGLVSPGHRPPGTPPVPAFAVLSGLRDRATVEREFNGIVDSCLAVYNIFSMGQGLKPLPRIREMRIGQTRAMQLDLSRLLQGIDGGYLGELQLCWTFNDDVLIVASHEQWLRKIVESLRGQAARLQSALPASSGAAQPAGETTAVVQTGPIADAGAQWLDFLKRTAPERLSETWWRSHQPGGGGTQLGINATAQPEERCLHVDAVDAGLPAAGRLRPGDLIVGCNNRRFTTTQPSIEMRRAIDDRPHAYKLDIIVEREGSPIVESLPLPFFDPVQALRRAVAVGKIAQRIVYRDDLSDPHGTRGMLTVELRTNTKPPERP